MVKITEPTCFIRGDAEIIYVDSKKAQVATNYGCNTFVEFATTCHDKRISGCFRVACDNLLTTKFVEFVATQLVDNLQQAGKIENLQQICGVFGSVVKSNILSICNAVKYGLRAID